MAKRGRVRYRTTVGNVTELLKASLAYQTTEFFRNTSLHGMRYVAEKGRPFIEKLLWIACISAGSLATLVITVRLWDKFQTSPTITGLDTDFHSWEVEFPAVTICRKEATNNTAIESFVKSEWSGEDEAQKKEFLQKLVDMSVDTLPMLASYFDNEKLHTLPQNYGNLKNLMFKLMLRCEDFLSDCTFLAADSDCCKLFAPTFTEHGICYTFNSRHSEKNWPWAEEELPPFEAKHVQETDTDWGFSFSTDESDSTPTLIFLHDSNEMPGTDIYPLHVWDKRINRISFSVKQTYTTEDAKSLTIKQRKCIFADEVHLEIDTVYSFTACTKQCRMDNMMRICGCVPFFYPNLTNYKYCSLKELSCIAKQMKSIKNTNKCNCQLGCSNAVYEVEKLNENVENEHFFRVEFVSWPMVRYKREVYFGWVDLLVGFGGIAGLFLGFSLLSGVEIVYYFTLRAVCMIFKERELLENIILDKKVKGNARAAEGLRRREASRRQIQVLPWDFAPKNAEKSPFGIEFLQ